ncbi:MAG: hypothetical protein KVP17_004778 [Porospora cf. gigantea B]|uniref:uncharacterized protein n=1 Tax=Porospora cf. gigantea B TaxID=2853592 RepID=UPI003571A303|nr:MAG: hypothetical protein KVP17_004778 [Porospora cf. gigantea B]
MPVSGLVWQLMPEDSEDGPSWESSTPVTTAVASVDSTMHSATIAKPGARFAFARKFHVPFLKRPGKAGRKLPEAGPLLPPQAACVAGRKTLVLDLDETLVHSNFEGNAPSFTVQVNIADAVHNIHVAKRPYTDSFLEFCAKHFEVVIFTASMEKYACPVVDVLDPNKKLFHGRLFRQHCTPQADNFVKDLSTLGRELAQVVIVDNSPAAFALQPDNAIQILSWFDDPDDRELLDLIPILEALSREDDIPAIMRRAYRILT